MSTDLSSLLDLPANFSNLKLITVTGDDLNNSSFVLHNLIQNKLRSLSASKSAASLPVRLVLILSNHSYLHYATVAAKAFGLNLKASKESGFLRVFDTLSELDRYTEQGSTEEKFCFERLASDVITLIEGEFQANQDQDSKLLTPCVIIDDLASFLSFGVPLSELYRFITTLRCLSFKKNFCLIVQSNFDESSEDDDLRRLVLSTVVNSDVWLDCLKLETGYSQHVDGTLVLRDPKQKLSKEFERKFHFKTLDRNTKLYVPGSLALV